MVGMRALVLIHPAQGGVASPPPHGGSPCGQPHLWLANRPYRTASGAPLWGPSGAFRAEQINVVAPRVDSVPPHGTSPLRGKPLRGFVQAALPPSAAFPPWAKFECAPGGLQVSRASRRGGLQVSSGRMPDETFRHAPPGAL